MLFTFTLALHAQTNTMINYIPLGDSYTIGTGTTGDKAFPALLTQHLNAENIPVRLVSNPAVNGFTTLDLIAYELSVFLKSNVDFTSLLIGVNDWVQGIDEKTFADNLSFILDKVQDHISNKNNIVLITIPDFSVTPQGKNHVRGRNAEAGIIRFNNIIKQEAKKRKLAVVDIFELSRAMGTDSSLVADDDLHPSFKEYARWEAMIFPVVREIIKNSK